jgi:intraflagellar transport protein 46
MLLIVAATSEICSNCSDGYSGLQSLLEMIAIYQPETMELDTKLSAFIPEYIPSIGDIDPMIKIPIPSILNPGKDILDNVGIYSLDEPNGLQSDPAVADLALRSISLRTPEHNIIVRAVQLHTSGGSKTLQSWIDSVQELQLSKAREVKSVPAWDLEKLMAEWPQEIELFMKKDEVSLFL